MTKPIQLQTIITCGYAWECSVPAGTVMGPAEASMQVRDALDLISNGSGAQTVAMILCSRFGWARRGRKIVKMGAVV